MSLSSILPTPSLDHSTSPGGQLHSLSRSSGSLALLQATLWHHPPIKIEPHCGMSSLGQRWTSFWIWGQCKVPHEGCGRAGTTCRCGSWAGVTGSGPVGFDGSGHAPLLCDQGSNFSVHVMVSLELSCNSPVFLGPGVVVHGSVHRVVGQAFEEPVGKLPFFIDGDALRGKELMSIDGLINANSAQAVQSVQFNVGSKDMDGVVSISDWEEEVKDISIILFISLRSPHFSLPVSVSSIHVCFPVLIGCF